MLSEDLIVRRADVAMLRDKLEASGRELILVTAEKEGREKQQHELTDELRKTKRQLEDFAATKVKLAVILVSSRAGVDCGETAFPDGPDGYRRGIDRGSGIKKSRLHIDRGNTDFFRGDADGDSAVGSCLRANLVDGDTGAASAVKDEKRADSQAGRGGHATG